MYRRTDHDSVQPLTRAAPDRSDHLAIGLGVGKAFYGSGTTAQGRNGNDRVAGVTDQLHADTYSDGRRLKRWG